MLTPCEIVLRLNGRRSCRRARRHFRRKEHADRVRAQVESVLLGAFAADLQDLHVDDDLGARLVVGLEHPLDDAHHRRRGAHGQRVGGLVRRRTAAATGMPATRMMPVSSWFISGRVGMRQEERPDDLIFELRALLRGVLDDQDGAVVQHLVEHLVGQHQLLQRLLERHPFDVDRDRAVRKSRSKMTLIPVALADEVEHVAGVGVVEPHRARAAWSATSIGSGEARLRASSRSRSICGRGRAASMRSRMMLLEFRRLGRRLPVRGVELGRRGDIRAALRRAGLRPPPCAPDRRAARPPRTSRARTRSCIPRGPDRPAPPGGSTRPRRPSRPRAPRSHA